MGSPVSKTVMELKRFWWGGLVGVQTQRSALAQQPDLPNLPALRRKVAALPPDTGQVMQLLDLAATEMTVEPVAAEASIGRALALGQRLGYRRGTVRAWDYQGMINAHLSKHAAAVRSYQQAVRLASGPPALLPDLLAPAYSGLAEVAMTQEQFSEAERYLQQAQTLVTQLGHRARPILVIGIYKQLATLYDLWGNRGDAPPQALRLQERYARRGLQAAQAFGEPTRLSLGWQELGAFFTRRQRYDSAAYCLQQSLQIDRASGNSYNESGGVTRLAAVRLAQHRWAEAAALARRGIALCHELGELLPEIDNYGYLGDALLGLHDQEGAYRAARAEMVLRDTLHSATQRTEMSQLRVKLRIPSARRAAFWS